MLRNLTQVLRKELSQEELLKISCQILQVPPQNRNILDIKVLMRATEEMKFFIKLQESAGQNALIMCLKQLTMEKFHSETNVFKKGDYGDKFYVIFDGEVGVYISNPQAQTDIIKVNHLIAGQTFGEIALLNDGVRLATIKCETDCIFGVLDRNNYKEILQEVHAQELDLKVQSLQRVPSFENMTRKGLQMLVYSLEVRQYSFGQFIYKESDTNNGMIYIIIDGQFCVFKRLQSENSPQNCSQQPSMIRRRKSKEITICLLSTDQIFGEEEPFASLEKRQYSVQCTSTSGRTYVISLTDLRKRVCLSNETQIIDFMRALNLKKQSLRKQNTQQFESVHQANFINNYSVSPQNNSQSYSPTKRSQSMFATENVDLGSGPVSVMLTESKSDSKDKISRLVSNIINYTKQERSQFDSLDKKTTQKDQTVQIYQYFDDPPLEQKVTPIQSTRIHKKRGQSQQAERRRTPRNPTQIPPQQMRQIHTAEANKRFKIDKLEIFDPLKDYITLNRQISPECRKNIFTAQDSIQKKQIQNKRGKSTNVQKEVLDTISKGFTQYYINKTQKIQSALKPVSRGEKVTSQISPNPFSSRPKRFLSIQKRFSQNNCNTQLDSSLIVTSRESVAKARKVYDTCIRGYSEDGKVLVPCGQKGFRSRKWPIQADLYIMKLTERKYKSDTNMTQMEDDRDNYTVAQRVRNRAHKYHPNHIVSKFYDENLFMDTFNRIQNL